MLRVAEAGAGALVTKSIGMQPRKGYQNPTLVELDSGYLNAMGLPNPGVEAFREEMGIACGSEAPIIGSVFAATPDDFAYLSARMEEFGARAIELNLSCPHAKGYGMEIGVDPDAVARAVRAACSAVKVPVLAKLTPNTHRLAEVALAAQEAGASGIVAINTVKAMAISVEARRPILSNQTGGLSGPVIKPVGLRCVFELYKVLEIPIIGVGGIDSWRDATEYIMAGAVAVQIGSAVGRKGLGVFAEVCNGLTEFMAGNGFSEIEEMVGVAHG